MFLMIGSAEKAGSGVSKIISGWTSALWRRPYVQIDTEPDRITLQMPMFSVIPDGTLTDLKQQFGASVEALGKDELTALAVCHIEGEITNNKLQYNIDKHRSDITKMLQDLCKNNYLISENRGRWTTYRLNPNSTKNVDSSQDLAQNVDSSFNASSSKSGISGDKPFSSEEKNVDTSHVDTSHVDTSAIDGSHVDTSVETAVYKEKSSIQQRIMEACQEEYISVEEIAQKVNRAVKYLKNRVIPEMVKGGYLVKLYPQTNHPQQKYISKHN